MKQVKTLFTAISLFTCIISCQNSNLSKSTPYPIAFTSKGSDNPDIFLSNTKGLAKIKVTDHSDVDGYTAWAPDGKRLAFYAKYDGRKTWSIHSINTDGTNRNRLTHAKHKWDSSPAWSPDGKKIAFARSYHNAEKVWQEEIWIMNSDGSEQTQIKGLNGGGPYFTQDGRIVFHSKTETSEICIANIDGSNKVQLTTNEAEDWHPEVSPDGKQIAFMSNRDGNHEIYVMNIDGSNQTRLTNNTTAEWYPSWSPDGSKIIYSSNDGKETHIYIMNKDGSKAKKIIDNGSQAAWLKIHQ